MTNLSLDHDMKKSWPYKLLGNKCLLGNKNKSAVINQMIYFSISPTIVFDNFKTFYRKQGIFDSLCLEYACRKKHFPTVHYYLD